ncbi:hypothetical protein FHS19_006453 [Paenibacillus rhizosphaerae]|uniref:DUF4340 domain-containing protein n=1 Tax=Paenibacillus rhizosphaerae TaxID=297318 RepID=A0A839U1T0_9BACL|nr:hypothetical protein [Paenibacillus rhizosphaerae]MBB3131730.1 hypothetical protein [Paenibacillus rhizosphaerae]
MKRRGKWILGVAAGLLMVCAALLAWRLGDSNHHSQQAGPSPQHNSTSNSGSGAGNNSPFAWEYGNISSVEWEGRTKSWILQREPADEGHPSGRWLLNGAEITAAEAEDRLTGLHGLRQEEGEVRKASDLQNEVIVGTITVTLKSGETQVMQIASEPDEPEVLWILIQQDPDAYAVRRSDYLELEQLQ